MSVEQRTDPGLYDYWPYENRPKITWPNGAKVAFWVAPNIEFYELQPPHLAARPAWPRPEPDVLAYSLRDYGNRAGHWRMMDVMDTILRSSRRVPIGTGSSSPTASTTRVTATG